MSNAASGERPVSEDGCEFSARNILLFDIASNLNKDLAELRSVVWLFSITYNQKVLKKSTCS